MEKGQVYEMQYLTDQEKALINALRKGATVNVFIYNVKNIDTAIDEVNEFGPVADFHDLENCVSVSNWNTETWANPCVYAHVKKEWKKWKITES